MGTPPFGLTALKPWDPPQPMTFFRVYYFPRPQMKKKVSRDLLCLLGVSLPPMEELPPPLLAPFMSACRLPLALVSGWLSLLGYS